MDPVTSLLKWEVSEVTGIYYGEFGLRTIVINAQYYACTYRTGLIIIMSPYCILVQARRQTLDWGGSKLVDGGGGNRLLYNGELLGNRLPYNGKSLIYVCIRPTSIFTQQGELNFRWFKWRSSHILCMRGLNIRGFDRTPRTPPAYGPVVGIGECVSLNYYCKTLCPPPPPPPQEADNLEPSPLIIMGGGGGILKVGCHDPRVRVSH